MSDAKIAIMLKNGKIIVRSELKEVSQAELAMLIMHLELLRDELKLNFRKGVKEL